MASGTGAGYKTAMRTPLVAFALFIVFIGSAAISQVSAETLARPAAERSAPRGKVLPLKGATGANPCAAYGAGFIRVEGTGTCVKIGGAIDVGVGATSRH